MGGFGPADEGPAIYYSCILHVQSKISFLYNSKIVYGTAHFGARRMSRHERRMRAVPHIIFAFCMFKEKTIFCEIQQKVYGTASFGARRMGGFMRRMRAVRYIILVFRIFRKNRFSSKFKRSKWHGRLWCSADGRS